jgi:uncharacterized protein YnzC (UPF0291/DUF896 family)
MMEQKKITRLNDLFEKVVAENANIVERRELSVLYQEYINDGREKNHQRVTTHYHHITA